MNIGLLMAGCLCDLAGILALLYSIDLFHNSSQVAGAAAKSIGAASLGVVFFFAGAMCLRAAVRSMKASREQGTDGHV